MKKVSWLLLVLSVFMVLSTTVYGQSSSRCLITPASLDFGDVNFGSSKNLSFTMKNTGGGGLNGYVIKTLGEFKIVDSGQHGIEFKIAEGDSLVVTIRFTPTGSGHITGKITVAFSDQSYITVDCSGTGVGGSPIQPPVAYLDPEDLDFGNVSVGQSRDLNFTLRNTGGGILGGYVVNDAQSKFAVVGAGLYGIEFELGAGESRDVTVRFTPSELGAVSDSVRIALMDQTVTGVLCSGTGDLAPVRTVSSMDLDFGTVNVGESKDLEFTIQNTGGGLLTGTVYLNSTDFSVVQGDGDYSLAAQQIHTVKIRLSPLSVGTKTGSVYIDLGAPVQCTGTGYLPPVFHSSADTLNFGSVPPGETKNLSFTIKNSGGGILSGEISATCDEFSIISGGGAYNLSGGDSVVVTVSFNPTSHGSKFCSISVGASHTIACTGKSSVLVVEPTWFDWGEVPSYPFPEPKYFTITNNGTDTMTFNISPPREKGNTERSKYFILHVHVGGGGWRHIDRDSQWTLDPGQSLSAQVELKLQEGTKKGQALNAAILIDTIEVLCTAISKEEIKKNKDCASGSLLSGISVIMFCIVMSLRCGKKKK